MAMRMSYAADLVPTEIANITQGQRQSMGRQILTKFLTIVFKPNLNHARLSPALGTLTPLRTLKDKYHLKIGV